MAVAKMTLKELRGFAAGSPKAKPHSDYGSTNHVHTPMFMPVDTDGNAVVTVTTRQDFLTGEIGNWKTIHLARMGGIIFGVAALYLLTVNVLLAAAAGLLAGYLIGLYAQKAFFFYHVLPKRELLEGT